MVGGSVDNSSPRALPKVIKLESDLSSASLMIPSLYMNDDGDRAGRGWLRPLGIRSREPIGLGCLLVKSLL